MPLKFFLCLGSHKRNHRRNKKLSKLVKVHTDETTSIKLSSAGSSVLSVRSFVPSVSLNLNPTPPRKDPINEDREDNLIIKQSFPLTVNLEPEIDTIPKKVSPSNDDHLSVEDPLRNKDPPVIENNPSIEEDRSLNEDQTSNRDKFSDEDHSFEDDKTAMDDHECSPNEDDLLNEDISTKEDPLPSEEHLPSESSMNVSVESSSSEENEYERLICSAAQNSLSEEDQNELLDGGKSNESFMCPLIENFENMSTSSKTNLDSPTVFISAGDVKIISGLPSPSEFAEVLLTSVKEERAEIMEVKWKSPIRVEPIIINPVEIVEHDNTADYIELECDAWVPGQHIGESNIIDLNEYEEFIDEMELEDQAIFDDVLNDTAPYLDLDDDTYVPGQPTEELKILLTRHAKLSCIFEPDDKPHITDASDKTLAYLESGDDNFLPGTPTEDITVLGDVACAPNQSTDDLEVLLMKCDNKFEYEDEASNDDFQNESDFGLFKYTTEEIPRTSFQVALDANLSAGDSIPPTSDLQSAANENLDQHQSSKTEGSEQVFKENIDSLRKPLTEDSDYTELENPIDWCGDFAGSVFESENDKKSVSSDRSETEMAEINDLLWGNEEATTDFPISRRGQIRISERQRKFRTVLQNLIDAQSLPEFQSVFNVNVLREITMEGDSDCGEKKVFPKEVKDSKDVQFSIKEEIPDSDGNFQFQNDNQDTEMQFHGTLKAEILKEDGKEGMIEESKSCDESVNGSEMGEINNLYWRDEEMIDDYSKPESAHVIISKWRKKFRLALHKLIDMKNSPQNQSNSNLNVPSEKTDAENTDSGETYEVFSEVKYSNEKECSSKENMSLEGNSCNQNDSPIAEKHSHSILNEEALQHLEESRKKGRTDSSVESDLNEDCFRFKRARISETRNQTPKRKVIDQVIESTQKYSSPNCNVNKESPNHSKSENSIESKGNIKNQDLLHSTFQNQCSDSTYYSNLISQNKLKNAIERFVKKAEEYNQMLCNGQTASSMKDSADKITQVNIDQTTPKNRNTCADKLIKQFMNKQNGNESLDSKENSKTCDAQTEQAGETMLSSNAVNDSNSTLKEKGNNNKVEVSKLENVSPLTSRNAVDPDEKGGCTEITDKNSLISVKSSSNNEFTLNLNHRNGKRSFECTGDFVLSRGDIGNQQNAPPPLTIHLTSKSKGPKNHHSPTADSKKKSNDEKYPNTDPTEMKEHQRSQTVFDHFMKEALEPLEPNRRVIPIKRTGSLPFTFTFSSLENKTKPSEKSENDPKIPDRVSPTHSQSSKEKHSPKHVNSPSTSSRTHHRHNNNMLFGPERTSIAKRFLEASNAFKHWRNSLDGNQVLNPFDHGILKAPEGCKGQRGDNLKMKHLEMLHKRHDVLKNKRDIEKIERIEKCVGFSNSQSKPTKENTADYFGEAFDVQFKRYARKCPTGDLISYKRSTDWLTDAGIVGTLLTADEANKIFKRLAGLRATLNKQDYKRFLYKLTKVKRMSYNEICERLCGCAD